MARLARTVDPDVLHHVTSAAIAANRLLLGRRPPLYLRLLQEGCAAVGVTWLAWCLVPNHIHLILVPKTADCLRAALADAHRRYTRHVNAREGCTGYLFQDRFASYPMNTRLMAAVRYVERNSVAARLVEQAAR